MSVHPLHRRLPLVGLAVLAVAAPTSAAARPILDGPVDPPAASVGSADLRTPDARDAADHRGVYDRPAETVGNVDLRMPDTRDAANHYDPAYVPAATVVTDDDGFDWGSAGIGAGGALAGLGLAGFAGVALVRRRRPPAPMRTA